MVFLASRWDRLE